MGVANTNSVSIQNSIALPIVLSPPHVANGNLVASVETVQSASTDSIGSIYRYGFLPSGARVEDIKIQNDPTTTGVWTVGLYCNLTAGCNLSNAVAGWSPAQVYLPGNVVQFGGVIYFCVTSNSNNPPPSANWLTGLSTAVPAGSVPVPNAQQLFAIGVNTAGATATWRSIYAPGLAGFAAANCRLRVWELMNLTQDPFYEFHIAMTATTGPIGVGNIALSWSWTR
jgi:hypothetical protein